MVDRNQWGSNLSFILAMIGSAVGLGNIWRYPYELYINGGGAFYIPYIVAILLMGIPFLILEYGIGYNFKSSFPKALKQFGFKMGIFWMVPAHSQFHPHDILFSHSWMGRNIRLFKFL